MSQNELEDLGLVGLVVLVGMILLAVSIWSALV